MVKVRKSPDQPMGKTDLPWMEAAGMSSLRPMRREPVAGMGKYHHWTHELDLIWVFPSMCYLIAGWFIMDNPIKVETSRL